ncbi:Mth938-like domain-containing protein [Thiofilum flexile]|uniref:Mth938-like domain-containing protein n=1 Tax=Thiofilum flexile TaxID=125627 RepID=UPI00037F0908|nr:Mth938-like domain-containing protein [Thiofilum flexile]
MKFSETLLDSSYRITGYDKDSIWVNGQPCKQAILLTAQSLETPWLNKTFAQWDVHDLEPLLQIKAEVLLIGSGSHYQPLAPRCYQLLVERQLGFEIMDTSAACRTFNLLLMEARSVAAALFIN